MDSKRNRFRLNADQTSQLLGKLDLCASSSDFNLANDLCTLSDILWSIIYKQKETNPDLFSLLQANNIPALSSQLSDSAYKFYQAELSSTASTVTGISVGEISAVLKEGFKTLADRGNHD